MVACHAWARRNRWRGLNGFHLVRSSVAINGADRKQKWAIVLLRE